MAATLKVDRRKPAGQRFDQRIGAGIIAAGCKVNIVLSQQPRQLVRINRRNHLNILERNRALSNKCKFKALPIQMFIQPLINRRSFVEVTRPARRDQTNLSVTRKSYSVLRVKNLRVRRIQDYHRVWEFHAKLKMLFKAIAGLKNGLFRNLLTDSMNTFVHTIISSTINIDGSIHTMDIQHRITFHPQKPLFSEIERIEQAGAGGAGNRIILNPQAARFRLPQKRPQELMSPTRRRRLELVEDGQVSGDKLSSCNGK